MNEILKAVLSLSLSGTLLMLLLFLFRPLFKDRMSKCWQYYIWLIVIVRLLLPFTPETSLVGTLFHEISGMAGRTEPAITSGQNAGLGPGQDSGSGLESGREETGGQDAASAAGAESDTEMKAGGKTILTKAPAVGISKIVIQNLWLIWLVVMLILLIRKITIYQGFVRYIRAGCTEITDTDRLDRLAELGEQAGVNRPVELYANGLISSPLLLSFFRPCIVLADSDLPDADFRYTVLHELTHYKRRDMFYKWLIQITICLHWFNPLVYLMGREINRACELACDEAVIKNMDAKGRRAYGDTLVHAIGTGGSYKDELASVTLSESGERLKERLEAIMKYTPKPKAAVILAFAVTVMSAAAAISSGAYTAAPTPHDSSYNGGYNGGNQDGYKSEKRAGTDSDTYGGMKSHGNAQTNSGSLPDGMEELPISLDIDNGGVNIRPASSNEITAVYDDEYYDVQMTRKGGTWIVSVTGKVAMMGRTDFVQLYLPDIKRVMTVDVLDGDFSYDLPADCRDEIDVTAADGGVQFSSGSHYDNSSISLTAQNKDFIIYKEPVCPDYFDKTDTGVEYRHGTEENKISVFLKGYTSVEFEEDRREEKAESSPKINR